MISYLRKRLISKKIDKLIASQNWASLAQKIMYSTFFEVTFLENHKNNKDLIKILSQAISNHSNIAIDDYRFYLEQATLLELAYLSHSYENYQHNAHVSYLEERMKKLLFSHDFYLKFKKHKHLFSKEDLFNLLNNHKEFIRNTQYQNSRYYSMYVKESNLFNKELESVILENIKNIPELFCVLDKVNDHDPYFHKDWPTEFYYHNEYYSDLKNILIAPKNIYKNFTKSFNDSFPNIRNKNLQKLIKNNLVITINRGSTDHILDLNSGDAQHVKNLYFLSYPYLINELISILNISNDLKAQEKLSPIFSEIMLLEIDFLNCIKEINFNDSMWSIRFAYNYSITELGQGDTLRSQKALFVLGQLSLENSLTLLRKFTFDFETIDSIEMLYTMSRNSNLKSLPNFNSLTAFHDYLAENCVSDDNSLLAQEEFKHLNGEVIKFNNQEFKLKIPKSNGELVLAGKKLKNCVGNGSYKERIKNMESFILLGYHENNHYFCVEFTNRTTLSVNDVYHHHNQIFNHNEYAHYHPEHYSGPFFIIQATGVQNSPLPQGLVDLIRETLNTKIK